MGANSLWRANGIIRAAPRKRSYSTSGLILSHVTTITLGQKTEVENIVSLNFWLKLLSYYPGEIWKMSFISPVRPSSTLTRHENEACWKHSSNRRNLKTPGLRKCGQKTAFRTQRHRDSKVIFLPAYKSKMICFWCVFKSLRRTGP